MNYVSNESLLFDIVFIDLIKDIKLNEANKVIQRTTNQLLEFGYSKQELREYLETLVKKNN